MSDLPTFEIDGKTWRLKRGLAALKVEYLRNGLAPSYYAPVEEVEPVPPPAPCEHLGAEPSRWITGNWWCDDCRDFFTPEIITAPCSCCGPRKWRVIAERAMEPGEVYIGLQGSVWQFNGKERYKGSPLKIVVPVEE